MSKSKAVLFLEPKGTVFEVVRSACAQGYGAVALSSFPDFVANPPDAYRDSARLLSEVVSVSGWRNLQEVLSRFDEIAHRYEIVGIYSGLDPCVVAAATLRKLCGLPTTSPEALELVLDKFRLRSELRKRGLSSLVSYPAEEVRQWSSWKFRGAAYFKPRHGFFSAYVERCESLSDAHRATKKLEVGDSSDSSFISDYVHTDSGFHIEEEIKGELLSVEGIASRGKFSVLGLLSRILFSKNHTVEMGSCFPYPHRLESEIVARVTAAHQILGLSDGPTHTEVIVSDAGQIEIIDLNPRFVGADVLQSVNHAFDTKIEDQLLNFALGKPAELPLINRRYSCLQYVLPPNVERLERLDLPVSSDVPFTTSFVRPGTRFESRERQLDYLGCYLTVADTFDGALKRSKELRDSVTVNGTLKGVF